MGRLVLPRRAQPRAARRRLLRPRAEPTTARCTCSSATSAGTDPTKRRSASACAPRGARSRWPATTPSSLLATLQRVFEHERHVPGLFATLCTLEIDADGRSATLVRAGHPAPVLIDGDGGLGRSSRRAGDGADRDRRRPLDRRAPRAARAAGRCCCTPTASSRGASATGSRAARRRGPASPDRASGSPSAPDWRGQPEALLDELIAAAERLNGGELQRRRRDAARRRARRAQSGGERT